MQPGADAEARAVIDCIVQENWEEHRRLQGELGTLLARLAEL